MPTTPPDPVYLRIAADLRRRIREGALRPGQRLPSTRRLAKTWGVALATASRALELLAREGVTLAIPRVGSVVAGAATPSSNRAAREGALTRTSIVREAIAMADQEGLTALSMRGLAAKMGTPVTSLYRHVESKEDLLRFMTDAVMTEEQRPSPKGTWRERLEIGARLEWRLARRHPWFGRVMTLTRPIPSEAGMRHAEWMLGALEEAGVDAVTRMQMHIAIYAFVQGLAANVEAEAEAEGSTGMDEDAWMQRREPEFEAIGQSGAFPAFGRVLSELRHGFDLDLDQIFEFGIVLLIEGFAQRRVPAAGKRLPR